MSESHKCRERKQVTTRATETVGFLIQSSYRGRSPKRGESAFSNQPWLASCGCQSKNQQGGETLQPPPPACHFIRQLVCELLTSIPAKHIIAQPGSLRGNAGIRISGIFEVTRGCAEPGAEHVSGPRQDSHQRSADEAVTVSSAGSQIRTTVRDRREARRGESAAPTRPDPIADA